MRLSTPVTHLMCLGDGTTRKHTSFKFDILVGVLVCLLQQIQQMVEINLQFTEYDVKIFQLYLLFSSTADA